MTSGPLLLCVLDGFGLNPSSYGNAVAAAKKPVIDRLLADWPNTTLITHGERVGLPPGQMGNSEVGHLTIGGGRIIRQWLLRISQDLEAGILQSSPPYRRLLEQHNSAATIHLIGLMSDGGVHSHVEHLKMLITQLRGDTTAPIALHIITDGRDCGPDSGAATLEDLIAFISPIPHCRIASIIGRFFAMDRDKRWERTVKAYNLIACADAPMCGDPVAYLKESYGRGIFDEFIEPAVVSATRIAPNDSLIFWNFREDRMRQLVAALALESFSGFSRPGTIPAKTAVLGFTEYDHSFAIPAIFEPIEVTNHLGAVVAQAGLAQLRVAETEKYPHVTFFFNGGIEAPLEGETRLLIPSPRDVKTYDLKPEMSAQGVADAICTGIAAKKYALIIANFANCDMVGHTGVMAAAVKAVETVDHCLGQVLTAMAKANGKALIFADHGNAEQMINPEDGSPHTAHTTFPVPCILVGDPRPLRSGGSLVDIAPTALELLGIAQPTEMTGRSLLHTESQKQ